MGETVDTIPSILNKCLFVSPDRQTDRRGKQYVSRPLQGGEINKLILQIVMEFQQEPLMAYLIKCLAEVHDYDICLTNLRIKSIIRPAKSPDLGRRLPAFSLHSRLSGFDVHFTGDIENLLPFS